MKRKIWVKIIPYNKEMVLTALECGVEGIMVEKGFDEKVRELGIVKTVSETGDIKIGKDAVTYKITDGSQEEEIQKLSLDKLVILECSDWNIIPLENLIAKKADIAPIVKSFEEAKTAFEILEKGVSQVMVDVNSPVELKKILETLSKSNEKIQLEKAVIEKITPLGMGDRVCVDTCSSLLPGEGMLVGNTSSALFLVHAETVENPYVNPRPFRINAGPVHAYTRVPGGKTSYLSELKSGDSVIITRFDGTTEEAVVGRIKQEKRPLMLVEAKIEERSLNIILQNAETIRLTSPDGSPKSIVSLKKGDEVLVAIEEGGRHFGHKIEETITEK
ncbi:MAG: 3-dehydroquinate synthase II [Desulfobacteraceae bacterium]|nr:3-dehydroquinate synthase II [Desulfobacteraceae bacterium]